jgi:hypothetical protein
MALTPGTLAPFGLSGTYSLCPEARTTKFAAAKTRDEIEAERERERGREGERGRGGESDELERNSKRNLQKFKFCDVKVRK